MPPVIHDWHRPGNTECAQNKDINADCSCKLAIPKGKKKHKARIIFRVTDRNVDHRIRPDIWVEIHDNGKMIFRENKRRATYETSVGREYCRLVKQHAFQVAGAKARERSAKRKQSKASKKIAQRIARRAS